MIRFIKMSEGLESATEAMKPISGEGKFIVLPNGDYVFSKIRAHSHILDIYASSLELEFSEWRKLRRSTELSGGHWLIEEGTLVLYGLSQSYKPFDRTKAEEIKSEIAAAFGIENVTIESVRNQKGRYIY